MKTDSKELSEYIKYVLKGIDDGITEGYILKDSIEFEIAVVNIQRAEGGLKIHVVKAGGDYSKEEINKIKFEVETDTGHGTVLIE